uniref:Variant surface glycoprotein 1125.4732 n=1 Tax=Trypanosoma brucei TaxID=5691 RepID=A0A1J0RAP3_9TRYP|nr:variant surface glycoprotein 1125.4732 [Trypanosoma brucei]
MTVMTSPLSGSSSLTLNFVISLSALLVSNQGDSAITQGANNAEFDTLCRIIQLTKSKPAITKPDNTITTEPNALQRLTLTVAPPEWRKLLKDGKEYRKTVPDAHKDDNVWKARWSSWITAAKESDSQEQKDTILKLAGADGITMEQKAWLRTALLPLAEEAQALQDKLATDFPPTKFSAVDTAQETLKAAVYGAADGRDSALNADKLFKAGSLANIQAACEGAGESHPTSTVVASILCLCAKGSGGIEGACVSRQTYSQTWSTIKTDHQSAWNEIQNHCNQPGPAKFPASKLEEIMNRIKRQLHTDGTNAYLGSFLQTNCDGNSGNGICVKYTNGHGTATAIYAVPWIAKIMALAGQLPQAEQDGAAAAAIAANIAKLKQTAYTLAVAAKSTAGQHTTIVQASPTETDKQKDEKEKQKKQCEIIKQQEKCKENCKWDSNTEKTGNHCKVNGEELTKKRKYGTSGPSAW